MTIPISVRKQLGVKDGDKILFVNDGNKIVMMNATMIALRDVQQAFQGVAQELNIHNEEDVVNMVKEVRAERGERYSCE
ncbi:MAG: AbrB/MazE/SpoVT family DNA-binding domain-containing protein [Eubacteriales bacterium]|nr:AbrB/MazE/SpoVT family DNA-binding domain-containing protein [Eubacteriales bacterium]